MLKYIILAVTMSALGGTAVAAPVANAPAVKSSAPTVIWTAVFSDTQPNRSGVTQAQCDAETPTVMVTTIDQITSPAGVMALNQVNVRYLSYVTKNIDGLGFNIVKATVSGVDSTGHSWSEPMSLYEQNLSPTGVTNTVWSTPNCKGKFVGTATVL